MHSLQPPACWVLSYAKMAEEAGGWRQGAPHEAGLLDAPQGGTLFLWVIRGQE